MLPTLLNKRRDRIPDGAVYIGRGTIFGNPFKIGKDGDRDEVIRKYREWLNVQLQNPDFLQKFLELKNATALVCWCVPLPCHGQVILETLERKP